MGEVKTEAPPPPVVAPTPAVEMVPTMVPIVQEVMVPTPTLVETGAPTMMSSTAASNPMFMTAGSSYPTGSYGAPVGVGLTSYPTTAGYGYGGTSSGATMPAMGTTQGRMPGVL